MSGLQCMWYGSPQAICAGSFESWGSENGVNCIDYNYCLNNAEVIGGGAQAEEPAAEEPVVEEPVVEEPVVEEPVVEEPVVEEPASENYTMEIRMRGTSGAEIVWLWVGEWVQGWTLGTGMQTYTVNVAHGGDVRLVFVNDEGVSGRDVQVDYIKVNGRVHQAEHQSYNSGAWGNGTCGGGSHSEWLHCSGSVGFGQISNL